MTTPWFVPLALAAALTLACAPTSTAAAPTTTFVHRPVDFTVITPAPQGEWTPNEAAFLNDALYLLHESLPPTDARRTLLRTARYRPQSAATDAPWPTGSTGVFSWRTGDLYLADLRKTDLSILAATLAHELHHMELDGTETLNRMHQCDRERRAHAREAEDLERMLDLLHARQLGTDAFRRRFADAKAVARVLEALYTLKFELFRLAQAVHELDLPPDFAETYARLVDLAERDLAKDVVQERVVLHEVSRALEGREFAPSVTVALGRARDALRMAEARSREVEGG